ncbi:MAG: hypothetical protein ABSD57_11375 [Verrucomicrobiota bacterium]|jgi:CHASE3 domain sensor protein
MRLIALFLLLGFSGIAADTASPSNQPTTAVAQAVFPAPAQTSLNDKERELMLQNIKTTEAFDDKLLKTVHWTLASVFGVAVLLVGYNWLTSFKVFERERQRLKEETLNKANSVVLKLGSELEAKLQKAIVSLDDKALAFKHELSNLAVSLNASVEQRTIQFADDITKRLETHRREMDEALRVVSNKQLPEMETRLNAVVAKMREESQKELNSHVEELNSDLLSVTWRLYDNLGEQASNSEDWSGALTWHLRAVEAACKVGWDWMISDSLEKVGGCIKNNGKPTKSEKSALATLEKQIPEKASDRYRLVNASVQSAKEWAGS